VPLLQDDLEGLEVLEGAAGDTLLTEDDDLDRHPAMLPAVQLVERAAMLCAESSTSTQGAHKFAMTCGSCAPVKCSGSWHWQGLAMLAVHRNWSPI
jgi:hypothetical protein